MGRSPLGIGSIRRAAQAGRRRGAIVSPRAPSSGSRACFHRPRQPRLHPKGRRYPGSRHPSQRQHVRSPRSAIQRSQLNFQPIAPWAAPHRTIPASQLLLRWLPLRHRAHRRGPMQVPPPSASEASTSPPPARCQHKLRQRRRGRRCPLSHGHRCCSPRRPWCLRHRSSCLAAPPRSLSVICAMKRLWQALWRGTPRILSTACRSWDPGARKVSLQWVQQKRGRRLRIARPGTKWRRRRQLSRRPCCHRRCPRCQQRGRPLHNRRARSKGRRLRSRRQQRPSLRPLQRPCRRSWMPSPRPQQCPVSLLETLPRLWSRLVDNRSRHQDHRPLAPGSAR